MMNHRFSKKGALVALAIYTCGSFGYSVTTPDERESEIATIDEVLANSVRSIQADAIKQSANPYKKDRGLLSDTNGNAEKRPALSEADLLEKLAEFIKPTGVFVFGGEYYLVFKETKKKVGSVLEVTYQGETYEAIISNIDRNVYSIRYGDSEKQFKLK